ncbi:hypothetical protein TNCV_3707621 [Trichonephila clavipes]|nr:hypothetical protein TNCV_3707621 [Trichonephila clavipes]
MKYFSCGFSNLGGHGHGFVVVGSGTRALQPLKTHRVDEDRIEAFTTGPPDTNAIIITAEIESRFDDLVLFRCSPIPSCVTPLQTVASVVIVMDSWPAYHEFELSTTGNSQYRGDDTRGKSVEAQCLPVGVEVTTNPDFASRNMQTRQSYKKPAWRRVTGVSDVSANERCLEQSYDSFQARRVYMASRRQMKDSELWRAVGSIEETHSVTNVARFFGVHHSVFSQLWKQFQKSQTVVRRSRPPPPKALDFFPD